MGHHKKQEKHQQINALPKGEGTCPSCHKKVQSLHDHIMDQHRAEKI